MAVSDAHVFPGFLTPVLTYFSFQSHRLLSHMLLQRLEANENTPRDQTHNHQLMSLTPSPLSQLGGANTKSKVLELIVLDTAELLKLPIY